MHSPRNQAAWPNQALVDEILADERWYGDGDPHWPGAPTPKDAEKRRLFCARRLVFRPVQIKPCDGSARVISYAYKPEFVRRIAYHATITSKGKTRKCWMTRKVSLRPRDHAGLMEWLDTVGLFQRLHMFRVQTVKATSGVTLKVKLIE
jgi:hypothetical protein